MPHEIIMPQLGLTMTEGAVTTWLKQPGDRIEKGEMLFTVETDKVEMEVESTGTGYVSTITPPGEVVAVGTVIAMLAEEPGQTLQLPSKNGATRSEAAGVHAKLETPAETAPVSPSRSGRPPASPRARALAKSLGIDINDVPGGQGARIVEEDVKKFHAQSTQAKPQPAAQPMPAIRRITAERVAQSFERAPHFYLGSEVNAGKLVSLREDLQVTAQRRVGTRLTYTDFLLKAIANALTEQPSANVYWHEGSIAQHASVDIGFAAQTPAGLLVPVIRSADSLSLLDIAKQRQDLAERARAGSLRLEEMSGGSATLSNLGAEGIDWFQAILNPPQSLILAAGSIAKRPMVIEDRLEIGFSLILTLSVDHRVLDGVAGARFLAAIKRSLENPFDLVV